MQTFTKKEIFDAYQILNASKLGGLRSEEKTVLLVFLRQLRKISIEYEQDWKYIENKLKPSDFEHQMSLALQYEQSLRDGSTGPVEMTPETYTSFREAFLQYKTEFNSAMSDENKKEVSIDNTGITSNILMTLMNTNDWTVEQYFTVEKIIEI